MPVDTFSLKAPLVRCGKPVASSTTSWPRMISPMASESTLPCSAVMISANSPRRSLSSSRNLKITACRLAMDIPPHTFAALAADAMVASISSWLASATWPVTSPVAGLYTAAVLPEADGASLPSIQWLMSFSDMCVPLRDRSTGLEIRRKVLRTGGPYSLRYRRQRRHRHRVGRAKCVPQ